jgi:chaperone modulatory protein CbpM
MIETHIVVGVALEERCLTLEELASACAVQADWIAERIAEGLLPIAGGAREEWRFTSTALLRVQRMRAIERDFEAVPELAALVADLLDEMDAMRARLRREGLE